MQFNEQMHMIFRGIQFDNGTHQTLRDRANDFEIVVEEIVVFTKLRHKDKMDENFRY